MSIVGVIGGSGLYNIDGFENAKEIKISTPFGDPSDSLRKGKLNGVDVVFLARHGRNHTILPAELNHKANIYAMKKLGVQHILSLSAVGSLKEELAPLDFVIVDQYVDRTKKSLRHTFFGNGVVAHVSMAQPVCVEALDILADVGKQVLKKNKVHKGGTYINMEGPAFSTKAESNLYRSWGIDVIGMTNLGEARLAREAEISYNTVAMVTDYDCWHSGHDAVTVEMVMSNLQKNAQNACQFIKKALPKLASLGDTPCKNALATGLMTPIDAISEERKLKLYILLAKYLKK